MPHNSILASLKPDVLTLAGLARAGLLCWCYGPPAAKPAANVVTAAGAPAGRPAAVPSPPDSASAVPDSLLMAELGLPVVAAGLSRRRPAPS
jgi:hypothetical protein